MSNGVREPTQRRSLVEPGAEDQAVRSECPRWVHALDVATVVVACVLVSVVLFGPVRLNVWPLRFSASSLSRLSLILIGLVAIRHWLAPVPSLSARLVQALARARQSSTTRAILPSALLSRAVVLVVGYLAVVTIGYAAGDAPIRAARDEHWNLPLRWDTGWYLGIATQGYQWSPGREEQQNVAFFPAYPLLMRAGASLLNPRNTPHGLNSVSDVERFYVTHLIAGLAVTLSSFAWGLVFVYRIARAYLPRTRARRAVALLCAYPFAIFFSAPYSEGLVLLASAAAFYHAQRGQWYPATAWGLLAGLTRPNGFLLSVPMSMMAAREVGAVSVDSRRLASIVLAVAAPVAGMLVFSGYVMSITGNPLAWLEAHEAWGRTYTGLDALVTRPWGRVAADGLTGYVSARPIEALNAAATILALGVAWPVSRRFGGAHGLWIVVSLAPGLLAGGFLSAGRLTAVLFPMFLYLAARLTRAQWEATLCAFAIIQGLAATLFFTWRPLY